MVDTEPTVMMPPLLCSDQCCLWQPFVEFGSSFQDMDYIRIMYCLSCCF